MELQYISDNEGLHTAFIIPIDEWKQITDKHQDLKDLVNIPRSNVNKSALIKGLLNNEEAEKYHQYVKVARSE